MDQEKIGKFIKAIRKKHNLTQQQLASKLGVTFQAVSKWENGKNIPDIAILKLISENFKVDINALLEGEFKVKKTHKNIILRILLIIVIIFVLVFLAFLITNKNDSYNFKTIFSSCDDFKIFGSVVYNKEKSTIYISKVEYCGENDNTKYKQIESILYETNGDVDKKIDKYIETKHNGDLTLTEYLYNLTFYIDNYNASCKNFSESLMYLQLNATTYNNKVISYKIPLDLEEKCYDK